jgi:hypothetical protein
MYRLLCSLIALLFLAPAAYCCTCILPTLEEALAAYDVAFVGTVSEVRLVGKPNKFQAQRIITTFVISQTFKGDAQQTVVLHSWYGGTSCSGRKFLKGREYLVLVERQLAKGWLEPGEAGKAGLPKATDEILSSGACSRTALSSEEEAKGDIQQLEKMARVKQ